MSFFSKAWSSIKSAARSIGKSIKSAVGKVGKFVNKLGIVGQIGLMFILPGIGGLIGQGVAGLVGSSNALLAGLGNILTTVGKFASTAGNAFKTVTDGIFGFVEHIGKGFINQAATALGKDTLVFKAGPVDIAEGFSKWMSGVSDSVSNITSPFRTASEAVTEQVQTAYERTFADPISSALPTSVPEGQGFDLSNVLDNDFDKIIQIPDVDVLTNDQPFSLNIDHNAVTAIRDIEKTGMKKFLADTRDFAINKVKSLPETLINNVADTVTQGFTNQVAGAVGLVPDQPDFITNVTNIPEFNSAPITVAYEQNGLNYGALPDNRLRFFASQGGVGGDFGLSSFAQFAQRRIV